MKPNLRISIQTLLQAGMVQREISRVTGVDRKTIRRYAREANSPGVATGSKAGSHPLGVRNSSRMESRAQSSSVAMP